MTLNEFGSILSSTNEKQQKAVKNRRIKDMGGEKMICTVTFNPSLDYIVSVEDFKLGLTNRTSSELMLPGGKGINVSTVLQNLGIANTAFGFTAGFVGEEVRKEVEQLGVKAEFISLDEGVSRINLKLKSIDGTEINGRGPKIPREAVDALMTQLDRLGADDTLVLAGSIPASMPDDIYQKIMERLDGRDVRIVVDATKDLLLNVLGHHPFLIKPNNHELGDIFGVKLSEREEVVPYAKKLQEKAGFDGRQGRGSSGGGWKRLCGGSTEGNLEKWCRSRRFDGSRFPGRIRGERRL